MLTAVLTDDRKTRIEHRPVPASRDDLVLVDVDLRGICGNDRAYPALTTQRRPRRPRQFMQTAIPVTHGYQPPRSAARNWLDLARCQRTPTARSARAEELIGADIAGIFVTIPSTPNARHHTDTVVVMSTVLASVTRVLGTLAGATVVYAFQRRGHQMDLLSGRKEHLSQEQSSLFATFAAAVVGLRCARSDRRHHRHESPGQLDSENVADEAHLRLVARSAYYEFRLTNRHTELSDPGWNAIEEAATSQLSPSTWNCELTVNKYGSGLFEPVVEETTPQCSKRVRASTWNIPGSTTGDGQVQPIRRGDN